MCHSIHFIEKYTEGPLVDLAWPMIARQVSALPEAGFLRLTSPSSLQVAETRLRRSVFPYCYVWCNDVVSSRKAPSVRSFPFPRYIYFQEHWKPPCQELK